MKIFAKYVIISNDIIVENEEYNRILNIKIFHSNIYFSSYIFLTQASNKNNFGNKKIPYRKIRSSFARYET